MEGWMWFALGLVAIGFVAFAVLSEMGNRNVARDKDREHELGLAALEKEMYVDALRKPPTNIFQSRGRQIPDLLGRSRVGRVRWNDDEQPQVFSAELIGEPDDMEERLDNLEVIVSGGREKVAASAARVRASREATEADAPEPTEADPTRGGGNDEPADPGQEAQA